MVLGSGIRDPRSGIRKKPFPDPGSRGQKGTGSRIPDPDPQHCFLLFNVRRGHYYIKGLLYLGTLFNDEVFVRV